MSMKYSFICECITASGSWRHQLLAAMKKRRKSPNLPQNEGTPPLFWVLSGWGRAPIILGALRMRARPHYFGCSPRTNKHPSTFQTTPPSCLQHQLIPPPPLYLGQGGPHTPPPLLTSNPPLRPRGLRTAFLQHHRRSLWILDHNGHYLSSGNDLTVERSASKSSAVAVERGGILYWPAWWAGYKSRPRRTSGQSAASDRHSHTPGGHNLNYTIWILYAESVS